MDERVKQTIKNVIGIMFIIVAGGAWLLIWSLGLVLAHYSYQLNKNIGAFLGLIFFSVIVWFVYKLALGIMRGGKWLKFFLIIFWIIIIGIVGINIFIPEIWLK